MNTYRIAVYINSEFVIEKFDGYDDDKNEKWVEIEKFNNLERANIRMHKLINEEDKKPIYYIKP